MDRPAGSAWLRTTPAPPRRPLRSLMSAWLASTIAAVGCERAAVAPAAPVSDPGRAAAVQAEPVAGTAAAAAAPVADAKVAAGFCDVFWTGGAEGAPRAFAAGPAASPRGAARTGSGWRWVNFWATWCKPCLEELPLLGRWRDALVKEGMDLQLELWSVDEDEAALAAREKSGLPGPVWQVRSAEALGEWLASVGADRDAVLPVHVLVDPQGKIRCLRAGSVRAADYGTARHLLGR